MGLQHSQCNPLLDMATETEICGVQLQIPELLPTFSWFRLCILQVSMPSKELQLTGAMRAQAQPTPNTCSPQRGKVKLWVMYQR